jgi:methyltransferase (TIGR00027 family)
MNTSPIQDVSDTAFWVAAYRAIETERPDALFRDPLAAKLAGSRGRKIVAELPRWATFAGWMVAIRTRIIDAFIEAAVADGVNTVLNLGAGLDTRPYRMQLPQSLHWIEVDYPKIIELKESRLSDETPRCRLERVKLDLADRSARQQLLSHIAGKSRKVLVLTEGVILYLTTEEAASLADDLKAMPAFRYWIIDYLSPQARQWRQRNEKKMKLQNATFHFQPEDWFGFFREHGWQATDIRYIPEEAEILNRPLPLPFLFGLWVKLTGLFNAGRRRHTFRKSTAYALLEPVEASTHGQVPLAERR